MPRTQIGGPFYSFINPSILFALENASHQNVISKL